MTRLPHRYFAAVLLAILWSAVSSAQTPALPIAPPPILPEQFAGWQRQGRATRTTDPAQADAANSAILKEYSFTDRESATYKRDDGRTLTIRAARFTDASGAFGAYTYYLRPEMAHQDIGDRAASASPRVLFCHGHILVDAVFSRVSLMSPAELRELALALPRPERSAGNLPPVLAYMPKRESQMNTEKYAEGPLAFDQYRSPLSADLVDFSASAEVSLGEYSTPSGPTTLMLIYYPTPQIAAEHLRRIDAAQSANNSSARILDRRTGPIVAVAAGAASERDAKILLGAVNYEANLTWNENTYFDKKNNAANLLFNVIVLAFLIVGASIVFGIVFGGFRVLMKRLYPDRVFDRPEHVQITRLNLDSPAETGPPRTGEGT